MSSDRIHPEQIPTEYNEEDTLRAIRKQETVPGETREKTIADFPNAASLAQILKVLHFPADKKRIVQFLEQLTTTESRQVLSLVANIEEKKYKNVSEVAEAAGLVSR